MGGGRGAVAVLLLAVLARAVLLAAFDGGPARPLEGDERGYAAVAGSLARGEGCGFTVAGLPAGTGEPVERRLLAFRAPLLPAVLAPVHLAADGSPAALRWACALLGSLAAPLAFLLAGRVGGARAAWIAGIAAALWPSQAWLSARVLSEPLDAVLLLAAADLLLRRRFAAGGARPSASPSSAAPAASCRRGSRSSPPPRSRRGARACGPPSSRGAPACSSSPPGRPATSSSSGARCWRRPRG